MIGKLMRSGTGEATVHKKAAPLSEVLWANKRDRAALFRRTRPSPCDAALHESALADAEKRRLTPPMPFSPEDVPAGAAVIPRFGVEQGMRPDGTTKAPLAAPPCLPPRSRYARARLLAQVRAVDDCSAAHLNRGTEPQERMRHDTVDALFEASHELVRRPNSHPARRTRALAPAP